MRYNRSGISHKSTGIANWACLRQELMHAGERWRPTVTGNIRFAPLREQFQVPMHVTVLMCWQPLRHLWADWPEMVKEGADTTRNIPTMAIPGPSSYASHPWHDRVDAIGIGKVQTGDVIATHWLKHYMSVYNWHCKWPQDADITLSSFLTRGTWRNHGLSAVRLEQMRSRMMDSTLKGSDYEMHTLNAGAGREKFDIRSLTQLRGKLRTQQQRDWFGDDRYRDILSHVWDAKGTHEAEQIPTVLSEYSGYVRGKDVVATDGDNAGTRAAMMDFQLQHKLPFSFEAPEQGIFSYWLCVRPEPVSQDETNWFAATDDYAWYEYMAEPTMLAKTPPFRRRARRFEQSEEGNALLGYLPAGQEWRAGWNSVDGPIAHRGSFMLNTHNVNGSSWNSIGGRYEAGHYYAFRTASIGPAIGRYVFQQVSDSKVPPPMSSIMTGAD